MSEGLNCVLDKSFLKDFFEILRSKGDVIAPIKKQGLPHRFSNISSLEEADLTYTRTMLPPKKYFIKPEEVIFRFDIEHEEYDESRGLEAPVVLLGVHACDINAMNLLSRVFLNEVPDKYYQDRRNNAIIVGVSCRPDDHCFCGSTGTSFANEGFELFLHDIGDRYLVRAGSLKGSAILTENPRLFSPVKESDLVAFRESEKKRLDSFTLRLETSGLPELLDLSYDSKVWSDYGDRCLSCGSCNLVCPRCRCYDVQDYLNIDNTTGDRVRIWYSCMLKEHGLVAGGHNFRPTPIERIRNRFNCKGSLREGLPNCVGCGRCTTFCPAKIDFVEVMKKVRGEI